MDNFYISILGFLLCAAVIIYSGTKLSFYGNQIAELTGMGKALVGLILMASVTSLPELITSISAVAFVRVPDLAAGDIFGACIFNLLILSVLDARLKRPLLSIVKSSHIVAAVFGIILLSLAGMAIFLSDEAPSVSWISGFTFILFGIYFIAVFGVYKYNEMEVVDVPIAEIPSSPAHSKNLKNVVGGYTLNALIVIGAAIFLPYFGEHIAGQSGLGNSFFSTVFMAAATTLPELVVSLASLRLRALDMAVGNLLGSNVFNMFILGIADVFYVNGSLYSAISPSHLLSVFITIIMTAVVVLGLLFKPNKKQFWLLSLDTLIIAILYIALMVYLFINR